MNTQEIINKINADLVSCEGKVILFSGGTVDLGTFSRARIKNDGIIIFDFSTASVGLFLPLCIISIVKQETPDGYVGGDLCKYLFIDGENFWDIVGKNQHQPS